MGYSLNGSLYRGIRTFPSTLYATFYSYPRNRSIHHVGTEVIFSTPSFRVWRETRRYLRPASKTEVGPSCSSHVRSPSQSVSGTDLFSRSKAPQFSSVNSTFRQRGVSLGGPARYDTCTVNQSRASLVPVHESHEYFTRHVMALT